ncbi:hypothetical protein BaRGS_00003540 [Batillaria attramentaria]|uniref:Uncharacterized protein n=1 Tax=Batillaria attramentaria TaxID=370345 RepID=A0ABD0M1V7_9CAEN|nr:hypothetical protein BaRGS_029805 [Batillaria attramentaria]
MLMREVAAAKLLSKFLVVKGAIRFENKSADVKHAYTGQRVVIFDLARSQEDHINYEIIESIKNGVMFSSKYESQMKIFPPPHVVIFANFPPNLRKLSQDRWDIKFNSDEVLTDIGMETVGSLEEVGVEDSTPQPSTSSEGEAAASTSTEVITISDNESDDGLLPNINLSKEICE